MRPGSFAHTPGVATLVVALHSTSVVNGLGLDQPKVFALVRGRVEGYIIDRLFRFLNAPGQSVAITIRSNGKRSGRVEVGGSRRTS